MVYFLKINKGDQYLLNVVLDKNSGGIIYVQDGYAEISAENNKDIINSGSIIYIKPKLS